MPLSPKLRAELPITDAVVFRAIDDLASEAQFDSRLHAVRDDLKALLERFKQRLAEDPDE